MVLLWRANIIDRRHITTAKIDGEGRRGGGRRGDVRDVNVIIRGRREGLRKATSPRCEGA